MKHLYTLFIALICYFSAIGQLGELSGRVEICRDIIDRVLRQQQVPIKGLHVVRPDLAVSAIQVQTGAIGLGIKYSPASFDSAGLSQLNQTAALMDSETIIWTSQSFSSSTSYATFERLSQKYARRTSRYIEIGKPYEGWEVIDLRQRILNHEKYGQQIDVLFAGYTPFLWIPVKVWDRASRGDPQLYLFSYRLADSLTGGSLTVRFEKIVDMQSLSSEAATFGQASRVTAQPGSSLVASRICAQLLFSVLDTVKAKRDATLGICGRVNLNKRTIQTSVAADQPMFSPEKYDDYALEMLQRKIREELGRNDVEFYRFTAGQTDHRWSTQLLYGNKELNSPYRSLFYFEIYPPLNGWETLNVASRVSGSNNKTRLTPKITPMTLYIPFYYELSEKEQVQAHYILCKFEVSPTGDGQTMIILKQTLRLQ